MKKDIADKWVAALRSGKYQQSKFRLRSLEEKYCALGVLCEVAVQEEIIPPPEKGKNAYYFQHCTNVLPVEVKEWAGMLDYNGRTAAGMTVTEMNDMKNASFRQIANVIEKFWEHM